MSDDEVGKRIEALRKEQNLSQQKLAKMAGVSQTTIDKIEKGIIKKSKYLPEISKALNSPLHQILKSAPVFKWDAPYFDVIERTRHYKANEYDSLLVYGLKRVAAEEDSPNRLGLSVFSQEPLGLLIRPPFMKEDPDAYCVIVAHDSMEPEFRNGDVAYVSPATPLRDECTVLLFGAGRGMSSIAVLAFLEGSDDEHWNVRVWKTDLARKISKATYPTCHRVIAKTYSENKRG